MKKIILGLIAVLVLVILGCLIYFSMSKNIRESNIKNETNEKIIKVDNKLFYEVVSEEENFNSCGNEYFDGQINNHVDFSMIPTENNQSNFDGNYNYIKVSKNVIMICSDNTTQYFKAKQINSKKLSEVSDGELDIEADMVQELYNRVNPSEDASILIPFYEKSIFTNDYIISVGIVNSLKNKDGKIPELLSKLEVERGIHDVFGYEVSYTHQDVYIFHRNEFGKGFCGYWYRPNTEQYQLINGCGGNWNEFFKRKLVSATKKGDYIYLKEKSIYFYNDWDDYMSRIYVYNNYAKEKVLDYIEKSSSESTHIKLENYIEDASTYMYTFKYQNGHYIFESITRVD